MEEEYYGLCDNCDVETLVTVVNEEEVPVYCSMCGCSMEFESTTDE